MATGLLADAETVEDRVVELRRAIHHEPELGLDNPETRRKILDSVEDLPLEVTLHDSTTGIVADLVRGEGPTVLLRGDTDALPMPEDTGLDFASRHDGQMHACGHDAHTAMLSGAARVLAADDTWTGRIRFMFQPGEEGFHGARYMIDEGVLDGVDHAYALHVSPNLPSNWLGVRGGPAMASADEFRLRVTGRGGHASMPHYAADPIPALAATIGQIQTMVTRRVDAFDPAIVSVTKLRAGTTTNVIPEHADAEGTIRTISEETRNLVHEGLTGLARDVASAHCCSAEVDLKIGYPVTINDPGAAAYMSTCAQQLLGADQVIEMPAPVMGAEDFSYVLQQVPGAMGFLGVCPVGADPATAAANHSNRMMLDEGAMNTGVALLASFALGQLR